MAEENRTHNRVVKARVAIGSDDLSGLPTAERELAERLGLGPHRRAEWRAGREAARMALAALLGDEPHRFTIGRADDGAPIVVGVEAQISISHGRHWAVAAAGRVAQLGIDLCELGRAANVERISRRFLAEEERNLPRTAAEWATLWALKEAAAKALRRGLFDGGLAASRVATIAPPAFTWPHLEVLLEVGEDDAVAIVYS